jgi:hypothetical protein
MGNVDFTYVGCCCCHGSLTADAELLVISCVGCG